MADEYDFVNSVFKKDGKPVKPEEALDGFDPERMTPEGYRVEARENFLASPRAYSENQDGYLGLYQGEIEVESEEASDGE